MSNEFTEALARLDAEIAEAEAHVAHLRNMRAGADAFLRYAGVNVTVSRASSIDETAPSGSGLVFRETSVPQSPSELVMSAFDGVGREIVLLLDQIEQRLLERGVQLERQKIRNGIHYAVRKGYLEKAASRGAWRLASTNAEAPVSAGASEVERPLEDLSRTEEGGPDGTGTLHSDGDLAPEAQEHRRDGLSASMSGGN